MAQKGPGKAHRKGISLAALFRKFPDDATAEVWFAKQRWGNTPACPHCGSINVQGGASHKTMPYRCREKECARRFSVKTGTAMQASNLGYRVWAIAIYLVTTGIKGTSSMKLHRDLEITQKSAWHLAHRICAMWALESGSSNQFWHESVRHSAGEYVRDMAHNIRDENTDDQMGLVARGLCNKRLTYTYADLTRDNGLDSGARS